MEQFNRYVEQKSAQIATWRKIVAQLVHDTQICGGQVSRDMVFEIDDLEAKCALAQERLDELRAQGSEQWSTLATGVDSACRDLGFHFRIE